MKRVLVTLSVLLCLNVSAQEQLFFFGFEDGMASFTNSANALDSITQIQYYSHQGSNGAGLKPEEFELGPTYDTTMLVLNGIAPMGSRGDSYDIIEDLEGQHKGEFEAMSAHGGVRYFRYMAGGEFGGTICNDYEANLFVRALPISDYTSYRLSMYVKASSKEGQLNIDLMRGFNNSERQLSMTGDQYSGEFKLSKKKFTTNRWERVTMMAYYQNDSVANRYMYQSGYWWTNNWKKNIDGTDYNMIVQPDQYFVRLAFMGPGVTYSVDDISLTKSWIGGAEYYQNIMRVDFGYDTNLAELANATPLKAIPFPAEYIAITGEEFGEEYELEIAAAEYHNDGYLYIWIDEEDSFDYYEDVKVSFTNPTDEKLQLKYDGDLYPMALDTNWVNAGKIVPDFAGEPAFFNSSVTALSMEQMPPIFQYSEPEEGSFNLESSMSSFDVTFNKKVYVKLNQYDPSDTTSVVAVMRGNGRKEVWVPTAYNPETFTVTFSRQVGNTTPLDGDYEFDIIQARAAARTPQAEKKTITLNFGESDVPTEVLTRIDFLGFNKGITNIDGLKVNESCMMEVAEFKGLYTRALKFGLFGANLQNGAPVLTYTFNVSEAGTWYVKYGTSGCLKNSWNDGCKMVVTVIDPVSTDTLDIYTEEGTDNKPEEGGVVEKVDEQVRTVNFPAAGNYQVVFTLPNENSYGGFHKGGRVLYYIEVSTSISNSGLEYILAYNKAIKTAKELIEKASAELCYTGSYLNDFMNIIASKEHFVSTSPTAYENIVAEIYDAITNMKNRIDNVDNYYAVYQDVIETYNFYKEKLVYDELVALAVLQKTISDYAEFDVTVKSNDELNAIAANFNELIQTLHNRVTAIDYFNATLENAIETLEDYAGSTYAELSQYKELYNIYNGNKDVAVYLVSDSVLDVATMALGNAIDSFVSISSAISTMTEQVRELKELSEVLDVAWGAIDAAELAKKVETEVEDNQQLASVYKLAIKAKLELMIAAGEFEAIVPPSMSSFIQNTQFYTAIKGYATPDYQGRPHNDANAVKLSDQKGADIAKFLPGWVIGDNGGNVYTFNHVVSDIASESEIAMDWYSNITMSQTLTDLPAGVYSFEIDYKADNVSGLAGEIAFIQRYGDETYTDVLSMEGGVDKTVDFVYYGGSLEMKVRLDNTTTWSYFDNLDGLTFVEPLADYDYATAAENSFDLLETIYNEMCGFYSVNYYLDGELYRTELLKQGSVIVLPEAPTIEGYTFSGWEQVPNTMPDQNINIIGNYVVNHYKVEYVLDSVLFFTDSIAYGSAVPLPEAPAKEGYTFGDWAEVPESMPAQDITISGNYFVNYYKVEYIIDGEVYKTVSVAYGAGIPPIDMPTKEGYTFNGWKDIPDIMPAYDIIISGGFTILPKVGEYMLIEKIDGTIIEIKVDEIERFFFEQYNND